MNKLTPFPTIAECLLTFFNALDCGNKKKAYDMEKTKEIDYRKIASIIKIEIANPLEKYISSEFSAAIAKSAQDFLIDYLKLVGRNDMGSINRETSIEILSKTFFTQQLVKVFINLEPIIGIASFIKIIPKESNSCMMELALIEIKREIDWWDDYLSNLPKEKYDLIQNWRKGSELASLTRSITLMHTWGEKPRENHKPKWTEWQKIKALILTARAFDYLLNAIPGDKNNHRELLISLLNSPEATHHAEPDLLILQHQSSTALHDHSTKTLAEKCLEMLNPATKKSITDQEQTKELLDQWSEDSNDEVDSPNIHYYLYWCHARWCVLSGNLDKANDFYKKAFDESLFRAGKVQQLIMDEAIVIAANQKKSDMVFLKKLKNMAICLGYDIPSYAENSSEDSRYSASEIIESWEIEMWKACFTRVFPETGLFQGVKFDSEKNHTQSNALFMIEDSIKPDYKSPNRVISVGEGFKRRMPQINYFIMSDEISIVKKLLDRGASINVKSEANDTPILLALTGMARTSDFMISAYSPKTATKAEKIYRLLIKKNHDLDIINLASSKLQRTALQSAIDTHDPAVVSKIIQMGANIDDRALFDRLGYQLKAGQNVAA